MIIYDNIYWGLLESIYKQVLIIDLTQNKVKLRIDVHSYRIRYIRQIVRRYNNIKTGRKDITLQQFNDMIIKLWTRLTMMTAECL